MSRREPVAAEFDTGLPVLVLRTDANIFHHGTMGVIRSLGRAGVPVHAVLESGAAPAAASRHLRQRHRFGPSAPDGAPAALVAHLNRIGRRIGRPALLVPMDDGGAIFIAENSAALAERFVFPRQEPRLPRTLANKSAVAARCAEAGVAYPEIRLPLSGQDVDEAIKQWGLPVIAKWAKPWRLGPGQRSTTVLRTPEDAHALFAEAAARPAAGPLILQRAIVSPRAVDWFFHGYFDDASRCLFAGTGRKRLSCPPEAGHTVVGEWLPNPELEEIGRTLGRVLGYRGVLDLDFRLVPESGTYYLLDFNPRLGAQFRLFTDRRGLDLVRVMHLDLSGRPVPSVQPAYGRTMLVENHYLRPSVLLAAAGMPRMRLLRTAEEYAWLAADDLKPFLLMGAQSVIRAAEKIAAPRLSGARRGRSAASEGTQRTVSA
jgi:predicted ATP-grasp superfamily ATP-dependent carboligase